MNNNSTTEKLLVSIHKPTATELENLGVLSWGIWEKEVSDFDYHYDSTEECFFLEGEVTIVTKNGEYLIRKGDFVTFPKGLDCKWHITDAVKKHYRFS